MIIDDGNDLVALLVFVPRVPNTIPPFLATVLVPSPCSTRRSSFLASARCRTLATNACQSDPSSAHFALDRPRARSIAGLFSRRRLRRRDCSRPLASELDVKVSLHPAQASQRPCEGPVSSQRPAGCTILAQDAHGS